VPRKGAPGDPVRPARDQQGDLAPLVGADLEVMRADAERVRNGRPTVFTSIRNQPEVPDVVAFTPSRLGGARYTVDSAERR